MEGAVKRGGFMTEENNPERLINTLISKMESMDNDIQRVRQENVALRKAMESPEFLLKRAGFVAYQSPFAEDVQVDAFRNDMVTTDTADSSSVSILKEMGQMTNEEIHETSWEEIHMMAEDQKDVQESGY